MSDDELRYYTVTAVCQGGPLDGAPIAIPQIEGREGVLRGVTVTITLDDTAHGYRLAQISEYPFQIYEYRGVPVELPTLEAPEE